MTNETTNFDPTYKQTMISAWDQDNSNKDMRVDKDYLHDSYNPKPVPTVVFSIEYKA